MILKMEAAHGGDLKETLIKAKKLCKLLDIIIQLEFNEVNILVYANASMKSLLEQYERGLKS